MDDPIIRASNLGKLYRIGEIAPYRTLRDTIANAVTSGFRRIRSASDTHPLKQPNGYIWALKNVSFQVRRGEAVGVIGPNGAGKTTLLKVLSRITEPTEGWARLHGRMSALLEVGTGFHPELTGRENIYLNGAILGMTKVEIETKFEEIAKFAEIEKFINTPVKWYSDGMRVRLGFAIAAHLEPEILVVDEVLAVGDVQFQRKCLGKMEDVTSEGRTVVFVSHNMAAVQNLCTVAYALDHGRIFASGQVNDVIGRYLESISQVATTPLASRTDRKGTGRLRVTGFSIAGAVNSPDTVQCGAPASFEIAYEGKSPLEEAEIEMLFYDSSGICVVNANNIFAGRNFEKIQQKGKFVCRFPRFPLLPGVYRLDIYSSVRGVTADFIRNAATLQVIAGDYYGSGRLPVKGEGIVAVPHDWEVTR